MTAPAPLWEPGTTIVRWRSVGLSSRISWRYVIATTAILLVALIIGWISLVSGSASIGPSEVLQAIQGNASAGTTRIVVEWRLPRVLFSLIGGAALAVSGAVFQSITRNPLGSPDIIGFSAGAYTGALTVGLLGWHSVAAAPTGALIGGVLTGVAVYLLAWRGGVSGLRIIIVGIAVSVFLGSVNTYLISTMRLEDAITAASWGAGTLSEIGWSQTIPLIILVVLLVPLILMRSREMSLMEMGDDAASGLGVSAERVRVFMLLTAVALVAVVTAAAGPIAFVALAAPQLAMRITGSAGVRVVPAALMGALILTGSDLLARSVVPGVQLPVGVVTLCLGGGYLLWLLIGLGRKK